MNNRTYAGAAFAAIVLISCFLMYSKKETIKQAFPYQVIWRLDSVIISKDSSLVSNQLLRIAYRAIALNDSNNLILQFRKDSILNAITRNDSLQFLYYVEEGNHELIIKEDSENVSYRFLSGDSILQIITADNASLFFSKKN